jgi:hypothetical protein
MMSTLSANTLPVSVPVPPGIGGPPMVLQGEDPAGYEALFQRVSGTLRPADIFEEIWARDVVDLVWEVFRLRRLKVALMREDAFRGLVEVLKPRQALVPQPGYHEIARQWASGDRAAAATVAKVFATADVTMDAVHAKTFALRIDELERIDRMTMMAEGRRDSILREIDRYRVEFGDRLRGAVREAEDAEFKVIAPEGITANGGAPAAGMSEAGTREAGTREVAIVEVAS